MPLDAKTAALSLFLLARLRLGSSLK